MLLTQRIILQTETLGTDLKQKEKCFLISNSTA